jgi:hypothetical protein
MRSIILALVSFGLIGCKPDADVPAPLGNRHESQSLGLCVEFGMTKDLNLRDMTCEAK